MFKNLENISWPQSWFIILECCKLWNQTTQPSTTRDPQTQTPLSGKDVHSESSEQASLTSLSSITPHPPTTDGVKEAFSRVKSQTPSEDQTHKKICLRQARPNRISADCIKQWHEGQRGVTRMSETKLSFSSQTTVWSSKPICVSVSV